MNALRTVLEEKLVKRGVSLRGVDYGDVQEATQNTVRQVVTIKVGISCGQGQGDQQGDQGERAEGCVQSDAGRVDPGHRQEAGRAAGGDRDVEGRGRRHPAAVPELPRLSGRSGTGQPEPSSAGVSVSTDVAMSSAAAVSTTASRANRADSSALVS